MAEKKPVPPNTISDEQWKDLLRRAAKGRTRSMFGPAEVKRREQDRQQARKRRWS